MNPLDSTHRLSNDLLEKRDEKAHAFSPRDARWTLAWIWIAGGDNWNLARGSRFDFRQRARTLRRNRATFSSLISARTSFQLISFLFWQFFLQPTNLSRLSFTLAPTSSFFFFFSDTRSSRTAFWITPRTMRSLGVKEVERWSLPSLSPCDFQPLLCLSLSVSFSFWYFSAKFVIFLPRGAWRTSQDTGNVHVAMEFYLAEHFRPLSLAHHRAPSFTSFNCIIAPLCELGGGPVKGQSRWGRPFEVKKKNAERAPSMRRFSDLGRDYLRRLRFLVAGQYDN